MLKHTVIIATLLLATAASCQKDKSNDKTNATTSATAYETPKSAAINTPTGAATNAPTDPAKDVAAAGENPSQQPSEVAPQTEHEVQAASLAVSRARGDFLAVAEVRLTELDKKIAVMKKDKAVKIDWAKIDRLRADTETLRSAIKSQARLYTLAVQKEFEALVANIDERLR